MLEVHDLHLYYGQRHILKGVSFSVKEGEILCIMGESGSGKSSILMSIMGLLPKGAVLRGSIRWRGKELIGLSEGEYRKIRGREIGMVFQEPSLYLDPLFRVGSQVEEAYTVHFGKKGARDRAVQALKRAGIQDAERIYRAYPHQLSGGLKQRVCIAMAIVCDPPLLLADEPTTALDLTVQKRILHLLRSLRDEGKSILLVTHDPGVVAECADRVLVIKEGEVLEEGDVFRIFDAPQHPYTRQLISTS
ncbi:ABC transporter related protein [Thermocrinis albus DSM 14484]|uniref:ABC transporter related protein n=1 Tax=Thermocrinis albus (strain DSM 14484 / JCM 11386 / HI 11/12) TaxID=638303 RepID=D3SNP2_THEAH|nr:ABC transporter ATP-binding protein [Thermocrinis albus]ADC88779.1 ABC transporter related protein [Thermocrinis albus DSM 14484]